MDCASVWSGGGGGSVYGCCVSFLSLKMSDGCSITGAFCKDVDVVHNLKEMVDNLYHFRDHYFEDHPIENAPQKNADVENELETVLKRFDDFNACGLQVNRAMIFYLKGRALNVMNSYNQEAEDCLSKAVKLDPKLVEAWNEMGEVYWKKDNIIEAHNCFSGALLHGKNKLSLRSLSMVIRQQMPKSSEERVTNIGKGVEYAKEAVQLDANDGLSWIVLGNAYLSSFFTLRQDPKTLKLAMSAYSQAEKDVIARSKPDLHYNKAVALKYQEEFLQALNSFSLAHSLDPSWLDATQKEKQLIKYLDNIHNSIKQKGKMKLKRLKQMTDTIDERLLGPYQGGSYSSKGKTLKLQLVPLTQLVSGFNAEKVVLGKVVCSIHNEEAVPFAFCMVDKAGTCIAVTIYNIAAGKGVIIGDAVAIPEPYLNQVRIKYKSLELEFDLIRVDSPVVLVVNGKKVGAEQQASVQLSTFRKTE